MSEAKHTPGPWSVREDMSTEKGAVSFGIMAGKKWLGELCEGSDRPELQDRDWLPIAETQANARLMASAPELQAELFKLFSILNNIRAEQTSAAMGFGETPSGGRPDGPGSKRERATIYAAEILRQAKRIDDALDAAASVLAKSEGR